MKTHLFKTIKNTYSNSIEYLVGFNRTSIIQSCLAVLLLLFAGGSTVANNLKISNSTLSDKNITDHSVLVNFDVSW
jgi:hypothetical protein